MSVLDVIVLLVFIAVAVVGAEMVRRTCRRQLTSVRVRKAAAPVTPTPAATIGTTEVD